MIGDNKLYSQAAYEKAIADAYAQCLKICDRHSVQIHDQRSSGYMMAVEQIRKSIQERATGSPPAKL